MFKNQDLWDSFKKYKDRRETRVMLKDATQPQREAWQKLQDKIAEQVKSVAEMENSLTVADTAETKRCLQIVRLAHSECVRMLNNLHVEVSSQVSFARKLQNVCSNCCSQGMEEFFH